MSKSPPDLKIFKKNKEDVAFFYENNKRFIQNKLLLSMFNYFEREFNVCDRVDYLYIYFKSKTKDNTKITKTLIETRGIKDKTKLTLKEINTTKSQLDKKIIKDNNNYIKENNNLFKKKIKECTNDNKIIVIYLHFDVNKNTEDRSGSHANMIFIQPNVKCIYVMDPLGKFLEGTKLINEIKELFKGTNIENYEIIHSSEIVGNYAPQVIGDIENKFNGFCFVYNLYLTKTWLDLIKENNNNSVITLKEVYNKLCRKKPEIIREDMLNYLKELYEKANIYSFHLNVFNTDKCKNKIITLYNLDENTKLNFKFKNNKSNELKSLIQLTDYDKIKKEILNIYCIKFDSKKLYVFDKEKEIKSYDLIENYNSFQLYDGFIRYNKKTFIINKNIKYDYIIVYSEFISLIQKNIVLL